MEVAPNISKQQMNAIYRQAFLAYRRNDTARYLFLLSILEDGKALKVWMANNQ